MNMNREKTSSVMGIVISVLLHGIFLAGCVAIDFSFPKNETASNPVKSEITKVSTHSDMVKMKS